MACFVCASPNVSVQRPGAQVADVDCPGCGIFRLLGPLEFQIPKLDLRARSMISHKVRQAQREDASFRPDIFQSELGSWGIHDRMPTPTHQIDLLLEWLAQRQQDYSTAVEIDVVAVSAWIGALIDHVNPSRTLTWLSQQSVFGTLFEGNPMEGRFRLTMEGWERIERFRSEQIDLSRGFMAMKFHADIQHAYDHCFAPAVRAAGFEIATLAEGQPAGLIDDQLRVALRQATFVIADLTFHNNGAYWEAGFAEGLGRRVIYTCREDEWKSESTHFDTNHLATIIWSRNDYPDAARRLKSMIQATFPEKLSPITHSDRARDQASE